LNHYNHALLSYLKHLKTYDFRLQLKVSQCTQLFRKQQSVSKQRKSHNEMPFIKMFNISLPKKTFHFYTRTAYKIALYKRL